MVILFINPPFKAEYGRYSRESRSPAIAKSGALYYPLWLLYAAGVVDELGFDVKFIDAPAKRWGIKETIEKIKDECIDVKLVVLNTSTPSIYEDIKFGGMIKDLYPNTFTMLVGTHPSAKVDETLNISNKIDMIAMREYDYIVRDVAIAIRDNKDVYSVKGIAYKRGNEVIKNEYMEYIEDLDKIPFVSKSIKKFLDYRDYFFPAASYPSIQIFTGRGCPFRCNFCVYPQVMHGHKYRKRSPKNIVDEFEYIVKNFKDVKEIVIEDDTFTVDTKVVIEFCKLLIEKGLNKKIRWLCNARANLDYDTMIWMKKAGCRLIIPGFESGDSQILKNIKKGISPEQATKYVKNAKKAGLLVHACYMVGNEGESKETMEKTLNFALELKTDTAQFFPLIPYPGTEAYDWAVKNKYISGDYNDYLKVDGTHNCVLNLPNLTSEELVEFCDYARKRYYLRISYIMYRLYKGLKNIDDLKRSLKAFKSIKKYLFKSKKKG